VIILGVILIIVGFLLSIPVIWWIGVVLAVVGLILALLGGVAHRPVGGRAHWY
jgi:hypothetical protein